MLYIYRSFVKSNENIHFETISKDRIMKKSLRFVSIKHNAYFFMDYDFLFFNCLFVTVE